jgi:P-type E1-E2 ATPase
VGSFEAFPGKGVAAHIEGREVIVGSPRFLAERGVDLVPLKSRIEQLEDAGQTVIAASCEGRLLGVIALGDALRPDAREAIGELRARGLALMLVTGDNERAARRIASEVGITEVRAGVLPQDKARIIRELQVDAKVAMVGDGINDAPALMQADVGIAMGAGTDIAIEAADIIILSNQLRALPVALDISRRSYAKMLQNVTLAFVFNGMGIPLAATGLVHPVWAMVAMAVSVTAIFINSLWGNPRLFIEAIRSVGQPIATTSPKAA